MEVQKGLKALEERRDSFDLIFLDPPYGKGLACRTLENLSRSHILSVDALIVAEDLLAKLHSREDRVLLKIGERGATFLPQVWEQLPDKTEFLSHLATKAGCSPDAWRGKNVSVSVYHVEAFEEAN